MGSFRRLRNADWGPPRQGASSTLLRRALGFGGSPLGSEIADSTQASVRPRLPRAAGMGSFGKVAFSPPTADLRRLSAVSRQSFKELGIPRNGFVPFFRVLDTKNVRRVQRPPPMPASPHSSGLAGILDGQLGRVAYSVVKELCVDAAVGAYVVRGSARYRTNTLLAERADVKDENAT